MENENLKIQEDDHEPLNSDIDSDNDYKDKKEPDNVLKYKIVGD